MKEIKASDLRIGNLVNYKYYNPDPKAPDWAYEAVEIVEIKKSHLVFKHLNKKAKFKIVVLYPIPLTEEWLERFGGKKVNNIDWKIKIRGIEFYTRYNKKWYSSICDFYLSDKIQYVHELQNIYHALTGEELTINN